MNQQRYILSALLILFVAAVIYLAIKKFPQEKDVEKPQAVIYNTFSDTIPQNFSEGKKLFQQQCASCHSIFKDIAGPALKGVSERWPDKKRLYQFIRNPFPMMKNDPYYKKLLKKYGIAHLAYPSFTDDQIDAVFSYIETETKRGSLPIP